MSKTAILVDGGFYRKRTKSNWTNHSAQEAVDALITYCLRHLHERTTHHELYRIFYYDCAPITKQAFHPLIQKSINLSASPDSKWMHEFLAGLKKKRKVALRLGSLDTSNSVYMLTYEATKKLCNGSLTPQKLKMEDFRLNISQKGVDMKIGIDMASLAYKHQVDQIVLIAGDQDFVPAAKLVRREGIDLVLDALGMSVSDESALMEHIDGLRSCGDPYKKSKITTEIKAE